MHRYTIGLEPRYGKGIEEIKQGTFHVMTDEIKKKKKRILERRPSYLSKNKHIW